MRLDIRPVPAPTLTNLSATAGLRAITLKWDVPNDATYKKSEVWFSTSNNVLTATKLSEVEGNTFTHVGMSLVNHYYWVRSVNIYGRADGAWSSVASVASMLVSTLDIAASAVTAAKLSVAAIESATGNLANGAVTETKISDNAVTTAKITANAITAGKIAANAILAVHISAREIVAEKIAAGTITANEISSAYIYAGQIAANQITAGTASGARGSVELLGFSTILRVNRTGSTTVPAFYISDTAGTSTSALYSSTNTTATNAHHFASSGSTTTTLYVEASGSGAGAGKFNNTYAGKEIWLAPGAYCGYSPAGKGKFYAVDGLGPFTGFHDGLISKSMTPELGDILVDADLIHAEGISNTLFFNEVSSAPNQHAIGVFSGRRPIDEFLNLDYALWWELKDDYDVADMNAVGDGKINVCGEGGLEIRGGDLIVTSSIPGKGMKQSDNVIRSYTVARVRGRSGEVVCVLESATDVKMVPCVYRSG